MANVLVNENSLQAIANAIREKTGNSDITYTPAEMAYGIESIQTQSSSLPQRDVNFYDYDGTTVFSYNASDFLNLLSMPANPFHAGLTAQGWNWSLVDAKAYVNDYGKLNIGQMYITDDGTTRIYIHLEEGRTSPILGIYIDGTIDVDWGDNTTHDTLIGASMNIVQWTPKHVYTSSGDYIIKLTVTGSAKFFGDSAGSGILRYSSGEDIRNRIYQGSIKKIEIGRNNVISIGDNAFRNCYNLLNITIPSNIINIGDNVFYSCYNLSSITIPNRVVSIGNNAFYSCYNLSNIMTPNSITSFNRYTFRYCYNLLSIAISDKITNIEDGTFDSCYKLLNVTIPDDVTNIGNFTFQYCYNLSFIRFKSIIPPIGSDSYTFHDIPVDCVIYVPAGSLSAYTSAVNYPDPTVYTYIEE